MQKPLEKLRQIAEELNVPYAINKYEGTADEFAVYGMTAVDGDSYADNRAQAHIARVEFDYIQPIQKSYTEILFRILFMIRDYGFTEPQVIVVNDSDKKTILRFITEIKL